MVVTATKGRLRRPLACILFVTLSFACLNRASTGDGPRFATGSRACGLKFEPGPILDGRHRQPTPGKFKSRMQALPEVCQMAVSARPASPSACSSGDLAAGTNPAANPGVEDR